MKVNFLNSIKSRKLLIILVSFLVVVTVVVSIVVYNNQVQIKKSTKIVKTIKSTIDVKDSELVVKEWKIKLPVNSAALGAVSYKMINDNKLVFSSSKLDKLDLSGTECSGGVNKDSWGLNRLELNGRPNPETKYHYLPNYLIGNVRPTVVCKEIADIYAAFSYMMQYMERV